MSTADVTILPPNPTREASARVARRCADAANALRDAALTVDRARVSPHTDEVVTAANDANRYSSTATAFASDAYGHGYHVHAETAAVNARQALVRAQSARNRLAATLTPDCTFAREVLVSDLATNDGLVWVPTLGRLSAVPTVDSVSTYHGETTIFLDDTLTHSLVLPSDATVRVVR